jgi:transcription-repair coupling factor (superfamily II helicase)
MDRLLCGDVGYGKTEVALRAAFKVVMDGKQAALLVPTTILAHQHFQTFRERMAPYPVNIEMLSRFRSAKEQKEISAKLAHGEIDIIIATHRLLSEDIRFKDLGLLIIDEEQRFGVKHKEKLKLMRVTVDVLTMSATPIPRTLHMSLMGARDLSHIETPPRNRLPVITEIHEWDDDIIRRAVLREMDRGGQVYFVHNRVQTIQGIRQMLAEIIPEARIAVAHGQLPERQLEKIMYQFVHREFDLLVSTMIIENGLDIPNVNTIIIDRADKFGLAQLYQLRGRVGRSNEQAYAYLLVPAVTRLTTLAQKRLRAIQDFTDLGSGFKVALRDMEIRGIGNILGKEQSGNIQTVGFDLYCRLLEESVKHLKAQKEGVETMISEHRYSDPKLDVDFDLLIPSTYILSETERITVYHRMVNFRSLEELEQMKAELHDRFGPVPESVLQMIDAIELKILAGRLYAGRLVLNKNSLRIDFAREAKDDEYFYATILPSLLNQKQTKVSFYGEDEKLGVQIQLQGKSKEEQISFAKSILKSVN